jgi:16S rRNA processing protein RimM
VDELFLIAEIKSIYGSDGLVLIDSFSDFLERFFELKVVFLEIFGAKKKFFVENVISVGGGFAIKFKGFDSAESVKFLVGKKIFVDEANSVKLSDNIFFIHDLIGSKVFRNSEFIGLVDDVIILPANDVLEVQEPGGKKILIPAIKDYIESFDSSAKKLNLVRDCDLLYDDEN